MKSNKFLAIAAAAAALLATPLASQAAPVFAVQISDGTTTVTIQDNSAADQVSFAGAILGTASVGGWFVQLASGSSSFDPLNLHLTASVTAMPGLITSDVVTISMTQTGLSSGAGLQNVSFGATAGNNAPGSWTWAAYADDADQAFGLTSLVATSTGTGHGAASGGANLLMNDTYSATLVAKFDWSSLSSLDVTSGSQDLKMAVPEPGSVALVGLGLLALGAMRRRKA